MAPAASRQLPPGLGPEDQLAACRCGSRAGLAIATAGRRGHGPHRSGRGPVARARSASNASAAAQLRERSYLCARPASAAQPTNLQQPWRLGQLAADSLRSDARPPASPGAWAQLAASDRKVQRRRHLDEGIGLPHAHHRPPGEPQPRPGQVRQVHPRSLLRRAGPPEAFPAAALVGLQHRAGPGPTADRRVAGQPDQLQQPPQRSGDVQLASDPSATCAAARATATPAAHAG
jgi:hypothetical protein